MYQFQPNPSPPNLSHLKHPPIKSTSQNSLNLAPNLPILNFHPLTKESQRTRGASSSPREQSSSSRFAESPRKSWRCTRERKAAAAIRGSGAAEKARVPGFEPRAAGRTSAGLLARGGGRKKDFLRLVYSRRNGPAISPSPTLGAGGYRS